MRRAGGAFRWFFRFLLAKLILTNTQDIQSYSSCKYIPEISLTDRSNKIYIRRMGFYPEAREKSTFSDEMHQGAVHGPHKATSIFLAQKGRGTWDMT